MSARLFQPPDPRRPQGQAQPRGILRQPQNYRSSPASRSTEFDLGPSRRSAAQQQYSPDSRSPRRDRFGPRISLPMPLSKIDTENDSVARACGQTPSPPLRYQPESYRKRGSFSREPENSSPLRMPQAPRARVHDPRKLFAALDEILHACALASNERFRLHDCLEWADIRAVQLRDRDDRDERDRERGRYAQMRRNPHAEFDPKIAVIEAPLHDVVLYASTPTVIEGTTYDIPIIVHACVDVLLRTAIYQQGLFVMLPNRRRCDELIDCFNYGPSFGEGFNLTGESTPDVCCLLSTFLMTLPEPLMDPALFEPFFRWCVRPSCKRDEEKRELEAQHENEARLAALRRGELVKRKELLPKASPIRWTKKEERLNEELEKPQIAIAVILFKLHPSANFALLVYLLGFFTELPICPDNGMTLEETTNKFAEKMMGGPKVNSRKVMMWLLTRWPRISDGLFSESRAAYEEEVKKSKLHSPAAASSYLPETDRSARYRPTTISSAQSYESSATDTPSLVCDKPMRGLYRSMTSSSIVPQDTRFSPFDENMTPQKEKHHPAFAQSPGIQCNEDAFESDKGSLISECSSTSDCSSSDVADDGSSSETMTSVQQRLDAKDEELTVRTTELAAESKRHNEAMQIISDMKEEARLSAEQVWALRDDIKRIDDLLKEKATHAERQREDDRQIIADMKKMQKALEARIIYDSA